MALWLNLIPKLHRNIFQLESRFHQLGDHDKLFSFESNVTRFFIDTGSKRDQDLNDTSDHKQLSHVPHFDPPKLSPSDYHRNHNHFTHPSLEINGYDGAVLQSHVVNLNLSKSSFPSVVTPRQEQSTFAVAIPFIATITVGLALFCCNFVMFCAVCRQKAQLQKERMMMKLEISSRSHGDALRSSVSPNLRKHRSLTESSLKSDKDDTAFVIRTRDDPTIFHPSSPSFFSSPTRSSNTSPNLDFQDKSTESGSGIDLPLGDYSYGRQSLIRQSSKKSRVQFSRPESETLKFVGETRFIHHSSATVTSLTSSKLSNFPAPSANLKSVTFPVTSGILYQHKIPPPCFSQPGSTTLTNVRQQQQQHFRDQTLQQQKTRSILMNGGFHLATLPRQQSPKQQQQTSIVIPNAQQPQQHSTSFADAANNNTLTRQQHQQEVQDPHDEMEQKYCDEQPSTVV